VIMLASSTCLQTLFNTTTPTTLRLVYTSFKIEWHLVKCVLFMYRHRVSLLMSSPRD
jgi:hypothetical protein